MTQKTRGDQQDEYKNHEIEVEDMNDEEFNQYVDRNNALRKGGKGK